MDSCALMEIVGWVRWLLYQRRTSSTINRCSKVLQSCWSWAPPLTDRERGCWGHWGIRVLEEMRSMKADPFLQFAPRPDVSYIPVGFSGRFTSWIELPSTFWTCLPCDEPSRQVFRPLYIVNRVPVRILELITLLIGLPSGFYPGLQRIQELRQDFYISCIVDWSSVRIWTENSSDNMG